MDSYIDLVAGYVAYRCPHAPYLNNVATMQIFGIGPTVPGMILSDALGRVRYHGRSGRWQKATNAITRLKMGLCL